MATRFFKALSVTKTRAASSSGKHESNSYIALPYTNISPLPNILLALLKTSNHLSLYSISRLVNSYKKKERRWWNGPLRSRSNERTYRKAPANLLDSTKSRNPYSNQPEKLSDTGWDHLSKSISSGISPLPMHESCIHKTRRRPGLPPIKFSWYFPLVWITGISGRKERR